MAVSASFSGFVLSEEVHFQPLCLDRLAHVYPLAGMVERLGRRKLFLYSIGGMFFCMAAMTGISGGYASNNSRSLGLAIIPFLFLFQGFYSIAITPLPSLYCPEISPLHMRARAGALLLLTQACSQTFNQFLNPVALAKISWRCMCKNLLLL